eukprot:Selendium_serpulae@DN982_c0_g1_i1.p1
MLTDLHEMAKKGPCTERPAPGALRPTKNGGPQPSVLSFFFCPFLNDGDHDESKRTVNGRVLQPSYNFKRPYNALLSLGLSVGRAPLTISGGKQCLIFIFWKFANVAIVSSFVSICQIWSNVSNLSFGNLQMLQLFRLLFQFVKFGQMCQICLLEICKCC